MIAVCIATGPSLTQDDVDYCKDKARVIVINDSYIIAPWADILYAADGDWWDYYDGVPSFKGHKWTVNKDAALQYDLNHINYNTQMIWSNEPGVIATGGNSGFQAVNLAYLMGAKKIVLLGYDLGYTDKKHWFGEHPQKINRSSDYKKWLRHWKKAKEIIPCEVINATRKSNLECFKKMDIERCL